MSSALKVGATKPTSSKILVERKAIVDLAACMKWALAFLDTKNGGGCWVDFNTMESRAWEEKFMDALDGVGIKIDRKEFWRKRNAKPGKKKRSKKR